MTTEEFIAKANRSHRNKYNYSDSIYSGCHTKIKITCPYHGYFWQDPSTHLRGKGCVKCGREKTHAATRYSHDVWTKKVSKIHNNTYDYSNVVYAGGRTMVEIICPKHGKFQQTPDAHMQGRGCPSCNLSKAEMKIRTWLEINNIPFISQRTFEDCKNPLTNYRLRFDFYVPSRNLLIEYDGEQHFHPIPIGKYKITNDDVDQTQFRDKLKTVYAKAHDIRLLRISYKKFTQIPTILSSKV